MISSTHLKIGKFDTVELANKFSTPLYIYDGEAIVRKYHKITKAVTYKNKQLHYAVMCNDRPDILKILLNLGASVQVNSLKEYKLVRRIGFTNHKISVTTTNISPEDMVAFAKNQATINFDSIEEIKRYGELAPTNKKIGIRIFVDEIVTASATNKPYTPKVRVGIVANRFNELKEVVKQYNLKIVGIHGYLASSILDVKPFLKLNKKLLNIAKKFPDLEYINFGAGFGIALKPEEKDFNWVIYGKQVSLLMREAEKFFGRKLSLKIEPGRSLLGNAGTLLTRVTNIKDMTSWRAVGVDSGFGVFARPYLYDWTKEGYHNIVAANKLNKKSTELYTICSNSVLQGDYLAEDRLLPSLDIGDTLAILNTGAYGATMMSLFPGRNRAGEILIYKNKIKVIHRTEK